MCNGYFHKRVRWHHLLSDEVGKHLDTPPLGSAPVDDTDDYLVSNEIIAVQYNVLSLADPSDRVKLAVKLKEAKSFVNCLQVAGSSKFSFLFVFPSFVAAAPQFNGKDYGCEVLFNTKIPFCGASGKKLFINIEHVSPIIMEHRFLSVVVKICKFKFVAISAHAPYGTSNETEEWRHRFIQLYNDMARMSKNVFVGIDGNITFKLSEQSKAVGSVGTHASSKIAKTVAEVIADKSSLILHSSIEEFCSTFCFQ